MVTRKPVPGLAPHQLPPYPVTPTTANAPQSFRMQDAHDALAESPNTEETEENARSQEGLNKHEHHGSKEVPQALRIGPNGIAPQISQEKLRQNASSTNPFLQKQNNSNTQESSAEAWGAFGDKQPTGAPPPPPTIQGTNTIYSIPSTIHDPLILLSSPSHKPVHKYVPF